VDMYLPIYYYYIIILVWSQIKFLLFFVIIGKFRLCVLVDVWCLLQLQLRQNTMS